MGCAALSGSFLYTDFNNAMTRTRLAHTDANNSGNDGSPNVAINPAWTVSGSLGLTALTGVLTMGDFTWANIGSGIMFTTMAGGAYSDGSNNAQVRLTSTSEADRANFKFNTGTVGGSAAAPGDVAVFNLLFTVTGQLNNPAVSFRAGTIQTNGTWDNNTSANNGNFEVRLSPVILSGNNGTVNFNDAISLGGVQSIGAGAGPLVSASSVTSLSQGTYLMQIQLSGQSDQRAAIDDLTMVPEPSTYAALFGILALGFVAWRRRKTA